MREGFTRIDVPELEAAPANLFPSDLQLEPNQELNFLYNISTPRQGIVPPYREGGGDRALYPWIFQMAFQYASIENDFALRQGVALGYSVSDDGLTYLLHLNPNAIFQDGTPITARAVKDAWEFSAIPSEQVSSAAVLQESRAILGMSEVEEGTSGEASGLTVIDDQTLQIEMVSYKPTFPLSMAVWYLGIYKAQQALTDPEGFRLNPIGAGPYRASYNDLTGEQTYTVTSNYWGVSPVIQQINRPHVPETQTGYILYENQELDVLYADSVRQPAIWQPDNEFHGDLVPNGGAGVWFATFVTDHPPFDELNVRKAFGHGVDMWSIVPAIGGPLSKYADGVITAGNSCHQGGVGYVYDPALAQQALSESSYGYPVQNFPNVTIEISRPSIIRVFEIAQEAWNDNLGVLINLVRLEPGQQRTDVVEFRRRSNGQRIPDPSGSLFNFGHSTGRRARDAKFVNPELDAQVEAAGLMRLDDPNYCQTWQAVEGAIFENYYYLPLMGGDSSTWVLQPWVKGYVASLGQYMNTLPWWKIGIRDRSLYN